MARPHLTPCPPLGVILTAGLLSLFVAACGVSLSSENTGSEIFEELTIEGESATSEGEFSTGEVLALSLAYDQPYPVEILIVCDLLDPLEFEDLEEDEEPEPLARLLNESLAPNPNGGPLDEATPVSDTINRSFAAPEAPGRYLVRCRTDADEDNAIFEEVKVVAKRTPVP